ncbi:MAG: hypothetical protein U0Q18_00330 [Bryobacteraceae bacterium]
MDEAILDRVNESSEGRRRTLLPRRLLHRQPKVAAAYGKRSAAKGLFILGNHDRVIKKIVDEFVWAKEIAEVSIRNQPIVLCHYAMRVWHHSGRGA